MTKLGDRSTGALKVKRHAQCTISPPNPGLRHSLNPFTYHTPRLPPTGCRTTQEDRLRRSSAQSTNVYGTHDPIDARETTRQHVRCASPALCPDSTWQALTPALPICPAPRTPDSVSPARDRNERTQILKGPPELTIPLFSTNGNKRFSINGRTHTTGAHLPEMRPMCDAKNKSQIRQHKCNNLIRQQIFFQKRHEL